MAHARQRLQFARCQELLDGPFNRIAVPDQIGEALGAECFGVFDQLVEKAARLVLDAFDGDGAHGGAGLDRCREGVEAGVLEKIRAVEHLDRDAQVRLVAAVFEHRLAVGDAHPRRGVHCLFREILEGLVEHVFDNGEDVVLRDERHFHVELIELAGRAVGARVLVAEARRDLEIAVKAGHHQQLLEELRCLRQRVELAVVNAARHQIVACALRRAARQDRRLVFVEAVRFHRLAQERDDLRAQQNVGVDALAAQVQKAVFQAQVLGAVLVARQVERRLLRGGLHDARVRHELDLAGRQIGIDRRGLAQRNLAGHRDDRLEFRPAQRLEESAAGVNHDLREAVMVTQINEQNAAVVADTENPAGEFGGGARVGSAELTASVRTVEMHGVGP